MQVFVLIVWRDKIMLKSVLSALKFIKNYKMYVIMQVGLSGIWSIGFN